MSKTLVLIYPVHLYENIEQIYNCSYTYCLVEEPLYFSSKERIQYFNGIKLLLHRVSMKLYQKYLTNKCKLKNVIYLDYLDVKEGLPKLVSQFDKILYYDPVDYLLEKNIKKLVEKRGKMLNSNSFMCSKNDLAEFIEAQSHKKRQFFHTDFYRWQRKRLNILMDKSGNYLEGKLTFDKENRRGISDYDDEFEFSYHSTQIEDPNIIQDAIKYIKKIFFKNDPKLLEIYGKSLEYDNRSYLAFDHKTAKLKLKDFLINRFKKFGDYQDVIDQNNPWISHSLISASLNIGLLTPEYVVKKTLEYYYNNKDKVLINSVEGFIRQIIGWREYYRMVYLYLYDEMVLVNFFKHTNKLSSDWYHGTTGILPIDHHIKLAFKTGYLHHIVRLMIIGQFMLLCQLNPNEIYKWFMEFAVDSYDWVMIPNVYGMVGYNDGGATTTKIYISSSNYILKMSNFKKDGHWDKVWTALYYNFIDVHYDILASNPRSRFATWAYDRLSKDKLAGYLKLAKSTISDIVIT